MQVYFFCGSLIALITLVIAEFIIVRRLTDDRKIMIVRVVGLVGFLVLLFLVFGSLTFNWGISRPN